MQPDRFGMIALGTAELSSIAPDFRLASFADCVRRGAFIGNWRAGTAGPAQDAGALVLVVSDPLALEAQAWFESTLERAAPAAVVRAVAPRQELDRFLREAEQDLRAMDTVATGTGTEVAQATSGSGLVLSLASIEGTTSPVVRLVDSTLYDALKLGASDIHFELQGQTLSIKYRLDGVLQLIKQVEGIDNAHQTVSRIKVLADLDISERRVPQDGRFRVTLEQREIDFRVSVMPNIAGEDAVLRILDRKGLTGQFDKLTLDSLSLEQDVKAFIRHCASMPYGLLLVTGPTGSGKTTTLYAAISEINTGLDKIITIEDPIEYQLRGVLQIPVNEKKGLTFAKGLRSVLRHDPDKIMVGEIRDSETAHIAVQAALTGHQVFTTVHANNVFDVLGRFANMGVDSYSLVAALTGIMAQRLVRTLCPQCTGRPGGCAHCRGTGYRGRTAIAETLALDDEIKDLLVRQAPVSAVRRLARERGFRGLRDSALALVAAGRTTMDEVNRVTPAQ